MTKPYDEQDGFRKKAGERDFKIRRVGGGRSEPTAKARDSGWTLLDQVAGNARSDSEQDVPRARPEPAPVVVAEAPVIASTAPLPSTAASSEPSRPRFRTLLAGQADPSPEPVNGAYNGTPLKSLLRRIAERQAMNRPSGFDAWR